MLKVSNLGTGVVSTLTNKEWMVQVPQQLQDKGPCTIRVVQGRIQGCNGITFDSVSKVWCESNIPVQGCSTEVWAGTGTTGFNELFDTDLSQNVPVYFAEGPTNTTQTRAVLPKQYPARPFEFRCGGLPTSISFRAMVMLSILAPGAAVGANVVHLYTQSTTYTPQVEFHLSIVFDRDREKE